MIVRDLCIEKNVNTLIDMKKLIIVIAAAFCLVGCDEPMVDNPCYGYPNNAPHKRADDQVKLHDQLIREQYFLTGINYAQLHPQCNMTQIDSVFTSILNSDYTYNK